MFSLLLYRDLSYLLSYQNGAFRFKTGGAFCAVLNTKIRKLANLGGGVSYSYQWAHATRDSLPQSRGRY